MPTLDSYAHRFAYHAWASRSLADALTDDATHERARTLLAHALAADRVWLLRLRGEPSDGVVLWPALAAGEVRARASAEPYPAFLAASTDADLVRGVRYTNFKGEAFETTVQDILEHVLLHGAYHRGQVAAALRASGTAPPPTDYIVWVRAGGPGSR